MRSPFAFLLAFLSFTIVSSIGPSFAEGGAADEAMAEAQAPADQKVVLLSAPNAAWAASIDGSINAVEWMWQGQEAVYGFTGGRAATFSAFSVYVYETGSNPAMFEIQVGNEGVLGRFQSLGYCNIANMRLQSTPFQICKFPPITAHFVKVKLLATQDPNGAAYATEFHFGATLGAPDTAISKREGSAIDGALNLFNRSSIRVAPNNAWMSTIDGDLSNVPGMLPGQEAVYGFANGQAAKFDTFAVAINAASPDNPKTFKLLVANDPYGEFFTITKCNLANTKILEAPFQECHFAPVTAKYLKIQYLASQGSSDGRAQATEFRLFGKILPGPGSLILQPVETP